MGHAGRKIAGKAIHETYGKIGYRELQLFIDFCVPCQTKAAKESTQVVVKPILEEDFAAQCQVDLIDFQTRPDGEFKFIFTWQYHFTEYGVRLRPLKSKLALEVAQNPREIFMDLGGSDVMHTDNG